MNLFPLAMVALGVLAVSFWHNQKLHRFLAKRKTQKGYLPTVVTTLVMTAQLSELVKAVEHVDLVHISAAVMLLAVIVAGKSGTEHELH